MPTSRTGCLPPARARINGVASVVGLSITAYALSKHKVLEWGVVDFLTAALAVTNTDLLSLLQWETSMPQYDGMPDKFTAQLPLIGVVVEDLPQLFIQGFYLITSGDTGNLVVLVSVAMSGCSLLLRFARGAFAFATSAADERLAESSPMRNWDAERMGKWFAELAATEPDIGLEPHASTLGAIPAVVLLKTLDALREAQPDLVHESGEVGGEDRDDYGKKDLAAAAAGVTLGHVL